ncbi:MerR family transcriptional regulator [Stagnihabitans tardus]|uniref:MerR family DNA-binding protein n=1 Tax=Stagnihabitans tardus TaxID=2699202 RepID=A0AAE5BWQ1_9RHOB|nr:MerR family DNA-binding transcriptional regulator [Stagnihabitans tardus]NBZ88518.1 MerR family DNA-binding protein [Stagnihabitans tardus]
MDDVLTIGEMCETYEVTARTLRFYEQKELIWPIRRGARRLYDRKARARLQLILRGKRFGFSLEDIRQLLNMYERDGSNQAQLERTYELAVDRLAQMEAQRAELDLAIAELKQEIAEGAAMIAAFKAAAE